MANAKHEDAVMKMGLDYFRNTILKTLGIDYQYEEIGLHNCSAEPVPC